jgi:ferredoxin
MTSTPATPARTLPFVVTVDRDRCNGVGICEGCAPEVFEVDDHGELVLKTETVSDDLRPAVADAVVSCPTTALSLTPAAAAPPPPRR